MDSLTSQIKSKLLKRGASLVGFADISSLPADIRNSMNFAISIAVALEPLIINQIQNGPTVDYYHEYNRTNKLLTKLAEHTADYLKQKGFEAIAIPPTQSYLELDKKTLAASFQHKTAATLAALGWIGKSDLLVTKQFGSAIRLATVLTDAELEVAVPITQSRCGDCDSCISACPAKALKGNHWQPGLDREVIVDAFACHANASKLAKDGGWTPPICGICINVCPWTQKYISRENKS